MILVTNKTKEYYQTKLNKIIAETQYNPETKSFNFNALQLPKIVKDYNSNKFLQDVTQSWMADTYGSESANMAFLKAGEKYQVLVGLLQQQVCIVLKQVKRYKCRFYRSL